MDERPARGADGGALWTSAGVMVVGCLVASGLKVPEGDVPDLSPSGVWPVPAAPLDQTRPVQVVIEYRVAAEKPHGEVLDLLQQMGSIRRRDGGYHWSVSQDRERDDVYYEVFYSGSWAEHMDMHERFTREDQAVQDRLSSHLETPPVVRHLTVRLR